MKRSSASTIKPKQITMIYEDPFICTKPEGLARIIKRLEETRPGVDRYLVHFIGDPQDQNVERTIVMDTNIELLIVTDQK